MPTLLINPSLIQRYTPNFKHLLRTNCHQKTAHFIEITQGICPYRAMGIVVQFLAKFGKGPFCYTLKDWSKGSTTAGQKPVISQYWLFLPEKNQHIKN